MRIPTIVLVGVTGLGLFQAASAAVIPVKAAVAQVLLERAFERSVAEHRSIKPWGWADMEPVARLSLPRLGFETIVLDKGSGQAMAFGPSLLNGTAAPGEKGTSVVAAHRDTHFRVLKEVKIGDEIDVQGVDGRTTRYHVTSTEVTRWDGFAVSSDRSMPQLALVTCYPFDAQTHGPLRFVVHATRD
jgi:sortase A